MKFCYNCGAKVEEGDKFCIECGAELSLADVEEKSTDKAIDSERYDNDIQQVTHVVNIQDDLYHEDMDLYENQCREEEQKRLEKNQVEKSQKSEEQKKKKVYSGVIAFFTVTIAAIAIVIAVCFFKEYYRKGNSDGSEQNQLTRNNNDNTELSSTSVETEITESIVSTEEITTEYVDDGRVRIDINKSAIFNSDAPIYLKMYTTEWSDEEWYYVQFDVYIINNSEKLLNDWTVLFEGFGDKCELVERLSHGWVNFADGKIKVYNSGDVLYECDDTRVGWHDERYEDFWPVGFVVRFSTKDEAKKAPTDIKLYIKDIEYNVDVINNGLDSLDLEKDISSAIIYHDINAIDKYIEYEYTESQYKLIFASLDYVHDVYSTSALNPGRDDIFYTIIEYFETSEIPDMNYSIENGNDGLVIRMYSYEDIKKLLSLVFTDDEIDRYSKKLSDTMYGSGIDKDKNRFAIKYSNQGNEAYLSYDYDDPIYYTSYHWYVKVDDKVFVADGQRDNMGDYRFDYYQCNFPK